MPVRHLPHFRCPTLILRSKDVDALRAVGAQEDLRQEILGALNAMMDREYFAGLNFTEYMLN